uniref:Perilipin n=1 Tax=Astyanax mexicanus TaxID=7994 RepID=W5L3G0_ASTMX
MAENAKTSDTDSQEQQSLMSRVSNLPFVSSAYDAVSSAYTSTKDSVPILRGVMDAAESGVRTLGAAASTGTKPILDRLEPQIAMVNEYAMKGLDKVEEKLPVLQQPADKLVSETVDKMYQSVTGAKEAVVGAVRALAQSWPAGWVRWSAVGKNWVSSASELSKSQQLLLIEVKFTNHFFFPCTADLAEPLPNEEVALSSAPSYFVRLGKLSARVRERALELSVNKARNARDATHTVITQITSTLDLLETARTASWLGGAPEQLLNRWKEWREGQHKDVAEEVEVDVVKDQGEQMEGRTLSMVRGLSEQLRMASRSVVSSAQGLPGVVQEQLQNARRTAEDLHTSLGKTTSLTPLLLQQSRQQLAQVRQSLDGVTEYLLNNTPLNWLVGPFSPALTERRLTAE